VLLLRAAEEELSRVVVFLSRALRAPQVKRADEASKSKVANFIRITHRDQVEAPITEWLQEAYEWCRKKRTVAKRGTRDQKIRRNL
jgi:hypothetical protein